MRHSLSKSAGIALLIGVNIMWGLSFIFSKTALSEGIPSMTLVFLRYLITSALLVPACLHHERGIRLHAWAPRAFLTSMLGITTMPNAQPRAQPSIKSPRPKPNTASGEMCF